MVKVALLSLGCPKNLVDSEYMLGTLLKNGFEIVSSSKDADVIIVNTCAFIESAQQEAIDTILEIIKKKDKKKLCIAGCLVSLFENELFEKIPQIDAIIDPFNIGSIADVCKRLVANETHIFSIGTISKSSIQFSERCFTGPPHSAYLKIADGCNNLCNYCIIPKLRGNYRSRKIEDIIEEAKVLAEAGCREINIVAQDTTLYGKDIYNKRKLPELLENLSKIDKIRWIRLLYTHPAHYSSELIDTIANNEKVCKYLDIPLQHCNDRILKLMGRKIIKKNIVKLINKLRKIIPRLTLRTTFLVGFPTETDKEFNELLEFVKKMKFDHMGVFAYSPQENTPSFNLKERIPEKIKQERREKLLSLQKDIVEERNRNLKGKRVTVLIDKKVGSAVYQGRREADAPEIDNVIYAKGKAEVGHFCKVKITETGAYEFEGNIEK
jgi:ribosomal protein S12 methylthiotransferase